MKKLNYAGIMEQSSFKKKFNSRIQYFLKKEIHIIQKNLNLKNFKSNGANQIVNDIIKNYEKN